MSEGYAGTRLIGVPRVVCALSAALRPAGREYVTRVDGCPQVPRQGVCRPLRACGRPCGLTAAAAGLLLGVSCALLPLFAGGLWQRCGLQRVLLTQELEERPGGGTDPSRSCSYVRA